MAKTLTILSGKGGVGKSMITSVLSTYFAQSRDIVAVDCDVDAPNLAIWLGVDNVKPSEKSKMISTVKKPVIDDKQCLNCNKCVNSCQFRALEEGDNRPKFIAYRCEGCGLCDIVCPHNAITMQKVNNCRLDIYQTKYGFCVVQGQIQPGEAESGEAVTEIRQYAKDLASDNVLFVNDAAAGIGCPVIASIVGSDYCLAVVEPSKSSLTDLKRVLKVVEHFHVPFGVVINKHDLNTQLSQQIREEYKSKLLGRVSYDQAIFKQVVNLEPIIESTLCVKNEVKDIYEKVKTRF